MPDTRSGGRSSLFAGGLIIAAATLNSVGYALAEPPATTTVTFDIPAGSLADALDRFGEQSGLQVAYDQDLVVGKRAARVAGQFKAEIVLDQLLSGSGISWSYINAKTVVLQSIPAATPEPQQVDSSWRGQSAPGSPKPAGVTQLSEVRVTASHWPSPAGQVSDFALGFNKSLLETPRTVSTISGEQLNLQGISTIEDMLRVVPGTFTTTRYDLQGGINVRSVAADVYFRGMKRLTFQGHARTDLVAMNSLEIVEGPPSPIYGMGAMGGYVNMTPKSARAQSGAYLPELQGFVEASYGSYQNRMAQAGLGQPYSLEGKQGGYYLYALAENSDDFVEQVGVRQKIIQASTSLNNFVGPFRLESGVQYQNSNTSGSYMNRGTQDLVDHGRYITGSPLVSLDSNGDGRIGFLDEHRNSPVVGAVSSGNQPLLQYYAWPINAATGMPYPLGQFPVKAGIPQSMLDYLNQHPEADPTGQLRVQGAGGPLPISGHLPAGFVLDPRTVGYTQVNWHRNGAFERRQDADVWLYYFDLIDDANPEFTTKNQVFLDNLTQTKDSYLPYGEFLDMHALEDKLTVTRRVPALLLPAWLHVDGSGSLRYRLTRAAIISSGDDFDYRQDVMGPNAGRLYPNTSFWNWVDNPSYATGAPATINRKSSYDEFGAGMMVDLNARSGTDLLAGGRWDGAQASGRDYQRFNQGAGTPAAPGGWLPYDSAGGWNSGTSWSLSLSQKLPYGLHPYVTIAQSARVLDDINDVLSVPIINAPGGFVGTSHLKEAGIKASLFDDRLYAATSVFQQTRTDVAPPSSPAGSAYVTRTRAGGVETQLRWAPSKRYELDGYALYQTSKYLLNSQEMVELNGRELGFKDVTDPATGKVIYPAEAFLYGGRTLMTIPPSLLGRYSKRTGDPERQFGLNAFALLGRGFGFHAGGTWLSSTYLDRLQSVVLPSSLVFNAGLSWDMQRLHFKLNGYNIGNELYFRARSTDASNNMATVLPGQRVEFSAKVDF
ncbi:MAG: TonB-dependent receptor plug domain-containing protein [Nevskia sp.]|nr:TonB-dependent receptor plug domain-containing protein [Nevskia sp.]